MMNRQQAEHILEAYINMECSGGDNNARAALREVILDAMTMTRYTVNNAGTITRPCSIWTIPAYGNRNTVTCGGDAE